MTANTQKINAKSVFAYVLLPGIIPRLKDLGGTGFGYLSFLIASVFQGVRILPHNHPYVNYNNLGKFGIREVLAAAANNIEFSRKNADQIVVFGAILVSMVLLALQFAFFILALFTGHAFAADPAAATSFTSIFKTDRPENDIAFMMLDYVFGIPNLFGSHALTGADGGATAPTPFHVGLHDLFQFYNNAILVVAVLVFMYYVIVVVIETAQTGVPFGRRFSKIYAPFRLIAAVGLLVPLNYGFNAAQYITFYAAKLGSSLATNGWIVYNQNLDNPMGVTNASLVAGAQPPNIDGLAYFATVYHACREIHKIFVPKFPLSSDTTTIDIKPYVIIGEDAKEFTGYTYESAKSTFGSSDVEIVLGELDKNQHGSSFTGGVRPYCGKIVLSLSNQNPPYYKGAATSGGHIAGRDGGVQTMEKEYYYSLVGLFKTDNKLAAIGERAAHSYVPARSGSQGPGNSAYDPCWRKGDLGDGETCLTNYLPSPVGLVQEITTLNNNVKASAVTAIDEMRTGVDLKLKEDMINRGWGGAGIWYNRVAELNGSLSAAIYGAPAPRAYPEVMEFIKDERQAADTAAAPCKSFDPNLADSISVQARNDSDISVALATTAMYRYWACHRATEEGGVPRGMTGNVFIDVVGVIFGINGLFALREDTKMDPETGAPKVHPLAALSSIGKALVDNAVRSMGASVLASFGGGMEGILGQALGGGLQSISKMFVSIATIGLTAGFILYYILPFLPFIYFFFAVGSWVKSIFEAMVGAPLWALAHLRIDGEGFSGRAASGGYFLIFEIFLRPIVTLFGLIGGMAIFSALVAVMNEIFALIVANIVGGDPNNESGATVTYQGFEVARMGAIDTFFFTIMYTILVYMMATACFKMIDSVPKQIMRWMGTQVSTFNDNTGDPTQNLTQYTALAGSQIAPQVLGGVNQGVSAAGGGLAAFVQAANKI